MRLRVIGVVVLLGVVVWAAADPRVGQLQTLINQVVTLCESSPALPDSVRAECAIGVEHLTAAATGIPPLPETPPPPPSTVGVCGESKTAWHPSVVSGCDTHHEHGDAPASFATTFSQDTFGHGVEYGGDEASSPMENSMKHEAFKGFLIPSVTASGSQGYLRYHAASNPADRAAQLHSYEFYYRDRAGNVSFFQGVYDVGNPAPYPQGARVPRRLGDPGFRPIMLVVDQQTWNQGIRCEQWYMFGNGGWAPEFSLTICNTTTFYNAAENATAMDQSTWQATGDFGLTRRAEFFWYPSRVQGFSGWFCANPDGSSGQPQMGSSTCTQGLPQYIAPSLANDAALRFGVRRLEGLLQKQFSAGGSQLRLPN